jgi:hypothetical protein
MCEAAYMFGMVDNDEDWSKGECLGLRAKLEARIAAGKVPSPNGKPHEAWYQIVKP